MIWSPSTSRPSASTASDPVGVAVEARARRRRRARRPRRCRSSGWVEPQPALMFVPSGSAWSTSHRRRRAARSTAGRDARRGAVGAVDDDPQPVERRAPRSTRPPTPPTARTASVPSTTVPTARRCAGAASAAAEQGVQLGLERLLDLVGQLAAARQRTASRRCRGTGCATPRSPRRPRRRPPPARRPPASGPRRAARRPRPRRPARRRAPPRAAAPTRRVSRPTTKRVAAEHPRRGAPEGEHQLRRQLDVGAPPRTPSVPNFSIRRGPQRSRSERSSAWSTAEPCGPS